MLVMVVVCGHLMSRMRHSTSRVTFEVSKWDGGWRT